MFSLGEVMHQLGKEFKRVDIGISSWITTKLYITKIKYLHWV
jgi:hypothetical protein